MHLHILSFFGIWSGWG